MNIDERLRENAINGSQGRIADLQRLEAPGIILDFEIKRLKALKDGKDLPIDHIQDYADREVISIAWKKGRGGKPYAAIQTPEGVVNFFPAARHGPVLLEATDTPEAKNA